MTYRITRNIEMATSFMIYHITRNIEVATSFYDLPHYSRN